MVSTDVGFSVPTRPESRGPSPLDSSVLKMICFLSSYNRSLLLPPEKKICHLLPLDKELPTPDKAEVRTCKLLNLFSNRLLRTLFCFKIQGLWKKSTLSLIIKGCLNIIRRFWRCLCSILQLHNSDKEISETRISDHTWTVGSEVTYRSVLSDELANFCAK